MNFSFLTLGVLESESVKLRSERVQIMCQVKYHVGRRWLRLEGAQRADGYPLENADELNKYEELMNTKQLSNPTVHQT